MYSSNTRLITLTFRVHMCQLYKKFWKHPQKNIVYSIRYTKFCPVSDVTRNYMSHTNSRTVCVGKVTNLAKSGLLKYSTHRNE